MERFREPYFKKPEIAVVHAVRDANECDEHLDNGAAHSHQCRLNLDAKEASAAGLRRSREPLKN